MSVLDDILKKMADSLVLLHQKVDHLTELAEGKGTDATVTPEPATVTPEAPPAA